MTICDALEKYRFMQTLPALVRSLVSQMEPDRVLTPDAKRRQKDRLRKFLFEAGIACHEAECYVKRQERQQMQILTMYYFDGCDQLEIADALNISRRTVARRLEKVDPELQREIIFPDMQEFLASRKGGSNQTNTE